jgi:hypothetical protein
MAPLRLRSCNLTISTYNEQSYFINLDWATITTNYVTPEFMEEDIEILG